MMVNNLSTGKLDPAVPFPLDEKKWKSIPYTPWSSVSAFYRKTLYIQTPDTLATPQDIFKNGYAILKFVEFEKASKETVFSFCFDNILEDDWIVGPNKDGTGGMIGMGPVELYNKRHSFKMSDDESKLKRKLKEAEDALKEKEKKAEELQASLDSKEQELMCKSEALAAQKRTHQTYISRKASEVKKLKQNHDETESKLLVEKEKLQTEVEAASRRCTLASSKTAQGSVVPTFYGFFLGLVTDMHKALTGKLDDIHTKAQKLTTSTQKVHIANPDEIIAFRFQDHHDQWTRVDDDTFQLLLVAYEKKVADVIKYEAYGNMYEASLKLNTGTKNVFEQVNVTSRVPRTLEPVSRADEATLLSGSSTTLASGTNLSSRDEFIRMQMDGLLFGDSHFSVDLKGELETLKTMLMGSVKPDSATLNHGYYETDDSLILKLSEFVQLHSSMASGYKYLSPDGDKSKSALIIQPEVIGKAFKKAAEENYSNIRLVFHGSSDYTSWLTTSFSFNHSGKNGSALGQALYVAMSDEVAAEYGIRGSHRQGFPKGNMMACLAFTPKAPTRFSYMKKKIIDYHNNNYNYNNDGRFDANIASRYVDVGDKIKHLEHHNALGFNDPTLVVPIGIMVPW